MTVDNIKPEVALNVLSKGIGSKIAGFKALWVVLIASQPGSADRILSITMGDFNDLACGVFHNRTTAGSIDLVYSTVNGFDFSAAKLLEFLAVLTTQYTHSVYHIPGSEIETSYVKMVPLSRINLDTLQKVLEKLFKSFHPRFMMQWRVMAGTNYPELFGDIVEEVMTGRFDNVSTKGLDAGVANIPLRADVELVPLQLGPGTPAAQECVTETIPHKFTWDDLTAGLTAERVRDYGKAALECFASTVYFVDSSKGLEQLERDLKTQDQVVTVNRDFSQPGASVEHILLGDSYWIVVLNHGELGAATKNQRTVMLATEVKLIVLQICKSIGYDPLREPKPAEYMFEYVLERALDFFVPRMI